MNSLSIEQVNITVSYPDRTARLMQVLFGWRIPWRGPALNNGQTIHVGADDRYLALSTQPEATSKAASKRGSDSVLMKLRRRFPCSTSESANGALDTTDGGASGGVGSTAGGSRR